MEKHEKHIAAMRRTLAKIRANAAELKDYVRVREAAYREANRIDDVPARLATFDTIDAINRDLEPALDAAREARQAALRADIARLRQEEREAKRRVAYY